jgi:predicted SnoaL-like aldol condensation-catalyzing enzyme
MNAAAHSLNRYLTCFEQLTPERLDELTNLFAERAHFKDPFNDVWGRVAIRRVFAHMYRRLSGPHFTVTAQALDGNVALLHWHFTFKTRADGSVRTIEGMSRVRFDSNGLVAEHIDHWDAAEQVYAKIPLLGFVLRRLRAHLAAC